MTYCTLTTYTYDPTHESDWHIKLTSVVTMVMKVLHNIYNLGSFDLTDMYALTLRHPALRLVHTSVISLMLMLQI